MKTIFRLFILAFLSHITITNPLSAQVNDPSRQIVLQGFWWDYYNTNFPNDWANYLAELAPRLKALGIDAVWIPPSIKNTGTNSVGYAPFDHYDLGDKYQKGSSNTRLGDKDELLRLVAVLKANGIDVIQDIILNHVTGAGSGAGQGGNDPSAMDDGSTNKYKNFRYTCYNTPAITETAADYLARQGRFSKNWQNFYPNVGNPCCTNEINSPYWGPDISYETSAFGLSSNATFNPTQSTDYMRTETRNWLIWYKKQVGWDGVRIDAVKHFPTYVAEDFLWNLQFGSLWASGGNQMYAVGEWVGSATELDTWANNVQNRAGTFDFALRGGLTSMVSGSGNFDIGTIPSYQQLNRLRTVPFVNNHDTYRPIVDATGNITGWNTGSQLGQQIEPNDGRKSAAYAISFAVDGSPQVFFEDLFNIGYLGNRFNHDPTNATQLPVYSDLENLLWCHQNLRFKEGAYTVRWQAADALVIERSAKALIAVTDSWSNWQNLNGVQTSWPDGTVLIDYSGANGTSTATVYGGGKVNIAIPPCDGSALQGRRGYSIWAPQGISANYNRPTKRTTQEWEMAGDLGDKSLPSLQQGGNLPTNSTDCRLVGRIFAQSGQQINLELYPENPLLPITVFYLDKDCNVIDSVSASGTILDSIVPAYSGWYSIRIKNATATQAGQKCYVKLIYTAPGIVDTSVPKNKCACTSASAGIEESTNDEWMVYPNPAKTEVTVEYLVPMPVDAEIQLYSMDGKQVPIAVHPIDSRSFSLDVSAIEDGNYLLVINYDGHIFRQRIVRQ
jgi:alpha-amylase